MNQYAKLGEMNQSIHHINIIQSITCVTILPEVNKLILIKFKILKKKKQPVVNFFNSTCKIPWFFPDFLIFIKFPDFSTQGFFFHHFPCFPESVATLRDRG